MKTGGKTNRHLQPGSVLFTYLPQYSLGVNNWIDMIKIDSYFLFKIFTNIWSLFETAKYFLWT
jgi:hypothetical protein